MSGSLFNSGIILFMVDNLICLNTTYFEKGVLVQNRRKIFLNYMRKHFITDFLSNIPVLVDYFFNQLLNAWSLLMLLQFLKNDRIKLIIRKLEEFFHLTPTQQQLVSLFKLLVTVLFIAHIFACIWLYIAIGEDASWLIKQGYEEK